MRLPFGPGRPRVRAAWTLGWALGALAGGRADPPPSAALAADPLDQPVAAFRAAHLPVETAFLAASRATGVTFALDPSLHGDVTLEVRGGTVRDLIEALAQTQGASWERDGRLVAIRRRVVRFYEIDYPQMTRSAQGSSTVVLSAQSVITGAYPTGGLLGAGANAGSPAGGLAAGANQNDQTNLSIQQQNQSTFWADVLSELTGLAQPGETVAVNKLAGLVIVSASARRQPDFARLVELLNRRVARQVRIAARILEVTLTRQNQLGVDWSLAASSAGGVVAEANTATALTALNGQSLPAATFTGTVTAGKVAAVVHALAEQGEVHAVSNPSVLTLSNQTAFIKVGTEQSFFSLSNSTTLNQAGAATPFAATQNTYAQNAITIGTVLYVTPEVNADGSVTVDVLPAVTQLIGVDSSPDGQQTAPRMDIKALSTLARLRPGEAVMLGGLIYDETDRDRRQVPGLSALPVVGPLFSTTATARSRSELVIFLTAECVR